ncbi:uncharacterized protein LOC133523655 [Cydia pomonella]|uniref:uncharacterized protein LOC133523655 n=1 Tax=Cydia pomonella TaxID=82600 RepID=UPI002ADDAF0F|nr:uncharacterized protein LOC133523655 [Cydia pomonella]
MGKVKLTTVFENLKFNEIQINTKLAVEYIKTNKGLFRSLYFEPEKTISKVDFYSNNIECADSSSFLLPGTSTLSTTESWTNITEKLKKLASGIQEKSDLFCQLEWLIRRIPVENTQHSIILIMKNLLHASADWKAAYIEEGVITMADNTPMLILGFVAQIFKTCDDPIILSTPQTAAVCHLFTELCREVGWNVRLILVDELKNLMGSEKVYPNLFNSLLPEITGIITERSDLDSAVDNCLHAQFHPLPLTRLLVQENVFEEFMITLDWKCKLNHKESGLVMQELVQKCSKLFRYGDKLFLINYFGCYIRQGSEQVVLVEAFRSVKELLSLVPKYKQLCLSIWASSVSEANEIALHVDVPIIWVNDYCNFTGSDEISKAIYKRIDSVNVTVKVNSSIDKMLKKQGQWLKKSFNERCDAVLKVIKSKDFSLGDKIEPEILNWKINNFICINNDTMILGFNVPDKVVLYNTFGTVAVPSPCFDNIIRALINGSAVIIASKPKNEEEIFIAFEIEGIPVSFVDEEETNKLEDIKVPLGDSWCFQTKVIWTTYGTIFAN